MNDIVSVGFGLRDKGPALLTVRIINKTGR